MYLRLSLALDYAFTRGYFPDDAELPMLVREPFVESNSRDSLSPPSISKTPRLMELETRESPIREMPDAPEAENQQQQQTLSPLPFTASTAPISSPHPLDPPYLDFDSMMESQSSPRQETPISAQFQAPYPSHDLPWTSQSHNFRDECLDFLNFESPAPDSHRVHGPFDGDQGGFNDDQLNAMDITTVLGFGNGVSESNPNAASFGVEQAGSYSGDHVNSMGVHTAMDFGDERPLWSDYMLNQILSPISTPPSGAS